MKECDILRGSKHTLARPTYFYEGQNLPTPGSMPLVSHPSCRRSIVGRTACEPLSMRIVNDGSPAPTFWSFVFGHDKVSPVEQQRQLFSHAQVLQSKQQHYRSGEALDDTVGLELIIHKDGSIVSITKISEVIMSNCSSLILWNLQLYNSSFEWKNVTFSGGQNILWPLLHISGGHDPSSPRIYAPGYINGFDLSDQGEKNSLAGVLKKPFTPEIYIGLILLFYPPDLSLPSYYNIWLFLSASDVSPKIICYITNCHL